MEGALALLSSSSASLTSRSSSSHGGSISDNDERAGASAGSSRAGAKDPLPCASAGIIGDDSAKSVTVRIISSGLHWVGGVAGLAVAWSTAWAACAAAGS